MRTPDFTAYWKPAAAPMGTVAVTSSRSVYPAGIVSTENFSTLLLVEQVSEVTTG